MDLLNKRFHDKSKELRLTSFQTLPGLLVFYDNKLICYKEGESQGFEELQLQKYHVLKVLAHILIFYSVKHDRRYHRISDMCLTLQKRILDAVNECKDRDQDKLKQMTIDELMREAADLFLVELHRVAQLFKQNVFNGIWPTPLVVIVAGPASPRIGHPAMQYFSRLTKKDITLSEMSIHGLCIRSAVNDPVQNNTGRFLYYVENPQNLVQTIEIGTSLYVEETIFSKYKLMNTDILAQISHDYLNDKCS